MLTTMGTDGHIIEVGNMVYAETKDHTYKEKAVVKGINSSSILLGPVDDPEVDELLWVEILRLELLASPVDKMVTHPDHYQSETGLETIDVIKAFTFDLKGIEAVDTGNILKYICRWKKKNGLQDLNKAKWYLEHLIKHVEKIQKENEQS